MGSSCAIYSILLFFFIVLNAVYQSSAIEIEASQTALLFVNASEASAKKIPESLFGIFFEEINHAGAGGLWAELVSNRGFEAGGPNTPSNIDPWSIIGDESSLVVSTERSSSFPRNKIALRMEVLCDNEGTSICPAGGVGIYNPGFWGMNIELGKTYKLVLYVRSEGSIDLSVSLTGSNGLQTLATAKIKASDVSNWTKMEVLLHAQGTDAKSRLQFTTTRKGVVWFDQVSLMPTDTYKGHGFRNDLFKMLKDLRPGFIRFPGGCFVEGEWLRNAFRWKETVGPWEERPGHFGDVWHYWTDDGLGHFEFLQLAEDLGAAPVWVFNNGVSHNDQVDTSSILPFVQEILDGIEFARGDPQSKWGSLRAAMGHLEPFDLRYVAVGNEDCGKKNYIGNYLKFYNAIKNAYPDIKIISNCDGSSQPLNHPADMYDYHIYTSANSMFSSARKFDKVSRNGPKAFVSEYAVTGNDAGRGSLLAALAEAGFVIGLEKNCDAVEMASYAPLFVNTNDQTWNPDAIVFDSSQMYGTPSYWMQHFFRESNGATLLNSTLQSNSSSYLIASAIIWKDSEDSKEYLRIKVVNFGSNNVTLKIFIDGLELDSVPPFGLKKTELTSSNLMDENSFQAPKKVMPVTSSIEDAGGKMDIGHVIGVLVIKRGREVDVVDFVPQVTVVSSVNTIVLLTVIAPPQAKFLGSALDRTLYIVYLGDKPHNDHERITESHHDMLADVIGGR
ncbi:Alpha-L-arabinofuranosidase 1 [Forsythia ovata]|uniref:non-reducing end alpha-L-arabinofuranosidase n=1 Tax=Forsythia ovata TaxID=205694 RepID=A0ABD1SPC4_9LAMI